MRQIILTMSLISLIVGCGRSPKKAAVLIPESETISVIDDDLVTINILGLQAGDWDIEWMTWKLSCRENEFHGTKVEAAVIQFTEDANNSAACTLQAIGIIPEGLKSKYVTSDGFFYTAAVTAVKSGRQTIEAFKKYKTAVEDDQLKSEELIATTKAGDKCSEFDIETFDCN